MLTIFSSPVPNTPSGPASRSLTITPGTPGSLLSWIPLPLSSKNTVSPIFGRLQSNSIVIILDSVIQKVHPALLAHLLYEVV